MRSHPLFRAYLALLAVYFFWGTTYLAIRMALEAFPPLLMIATRFVLSGALMLIGARALGVHLPRGRELWLTALYGVLILGIGNGCLTFAELWIPSGLAALFLTTSPFWLVGIEALIPGGERLHVPSLLGIAIGFGGVFLLVSPGPAGGIPPQNLISGLLILQLGCIGWNLGSILQRRQRSVTHPAISGAIQQFAAGLVYVMPAAVAQEHAVHWKSRGVWALLYLVIFGSIVGYSAYAYALDKLPVAVISTYTYVNPVVAVVLGWLIYREPFGRREAAAMALIFTGVAVVKWTALRSLKATAQTA